MDAEEFPYPGEFILFFLGKCKEFGRLGEYCRYGFRCNSMVLEVTVLVSAILLDPFLHSPSVAESC